MSTVTVHTDGGARGNPGPAAVGVVIDYEGEQFFHKRYIGEETNNVAEYTGVIDALTHLLEQREGAEIERVQFFLDSELVVRQINGQYKVKEPGLKLLHGSVLTLVRDLGMPVTFDHVRREQNKIADRLVNEALDEQLGGGSYV